MKFQCTLCGECCSHIRGMISEEDKKFLKEFAYGKLPLVQLAPVEKISFPLFDWEAKRFREWQEEAGIDAKINPSRAILDLNTNKAIIVTYFMDYDSCPFLKDKKCLIYNKKRAYICRFFPFNKGPFLKTKETRIEFGNCPAIGDIIRNMLDDLNKKIRYLNEALPYELLNIIQHDLIIEWVNKTIIELMKSKKIRPAMNYPYKFLLKRIESAEKTDFTDFLSQIGLIEKEKLIKRFDNNLDAEEILKKYL